MALVPLQFPLPILRCLIQMDPSDQQATLYDCLRTYRREVTPAGIHATLIGFLGSIADRSGQVPALDLTRAHFQQREQGGHPDGPAALAVLDDLVKAALPLLDPAGFRVELDAYREAILTSMTSGLLIEAANIIRTGTTVRAKDPDTGKWALHTVKGVEPALEFLHARLRDVDTILRRNVREGNFGADMNEAVARYDRIARDPDARVGVLSGLMEIDSVHQGIRRGDLALVLGFVGHLKSTFCLNWMYKAAVFQGRNAAMASLEMPTNDVGDLLICLHAMHPKFVYDRKSIFVTFDRLRAGVLTPEERRVLGEAAADLETGMLGGKYGHLAYKQPEFNMTMADIRAWCERVHEDLRDRGGLDLLVIDYLGLVDAEKKGGRRTSYENLNDAVRAAKLMAVEFDGNRGLPILSPFQANREGFKEAEKLSGRYTLRALHGAPEAERSADLVYYVYLDKALRDARELAVGNIKTRNVPMITDQLRVYADPATRMIDDLDMTKGAQAGTVAGGMLDGAA